MPRLDDLGQLALPASAVTIGSFDGVHRGHQALIEAMVAEARSASLPSVVLTFYPHPSVVLRGRQPSFYISTPDEKAALLEALGVEVVITQRFDLELSRVSASEFLDRLQAHLGLRSLWVGEDFALGYRREGDRAFLHRAAAQRGFALHVVPPFVIRGEAVSSTRVREALRAGDVARAAEYLGRLFTVPGRVVRGAGRGQRLGIPTANLAVWEERAYPAPGVYACLAETGGRRWQAVTNIGVRPTFEPGQLTPTIETHLLDFDRNLYGEEVRLGFVERLRDERRFPGAEALREQIGRDILQARRILDSRMEAGDV